MKNPEEIKRMLVTCLELNMPPDVQHMAMADALALIQQLEDQVPRWIPVEERMPTESDGTILVCFPDVRPYNYLEPFVNAKHDRRVRTATYSQFSDTWYIGDMAAVDDTKPIHWMPLPEAPKEDAHD